VITLYQNTSQVITKIACNGHDWQAYTTEYPTDVLDSMARQINEQLVDLFYNYGLELEERGHAILSLWSEFGFFDSEPRGVLNDMLIALGYKDGKQDTIQVMLK